MPVAPVDHQQMLLAVDPTVEMGMARGQRDAGITHLNHQIHHVEVAAQLLLRLGDVAGVPLNRWRTHNGTTNGEQEEASWITATFDSPQNTG